jgi:hypothetical protein
MKLPKQTKPVMRNAVHSGQINSGITPSGDDRCNCPYGQTCSGSCLYPNTPQAKCYGECH